MRLLKKIGTGFVVAGVLLVLAGGISIHRAPEGTRIELNLVHWVGGGMLLCGTLLAIVASRASRPGQAAAPPDRGGE